LKGETEEKVEIDVRKKRNSDRKKERERPRG
jgi:hypothetical protein